MNIFGILDNTGQEDFLRILFGYNCGIFLNFERTFINLFKILRKDEFCNFVFDLNKNLFLNEKDFPTEKLLYAKTSF